MGSTGGRRYLATYFGPILEAGDPIPLIYLAVQVADAKELVARAKFDQILSAARNTPNELGIDPDSHVPQSTRQQLAPYEFEPLLRKAIDNGYGLGIMKETPCSLPSLA